MVMTLVLLMLGWVLAPFLLMAPGVWWLFEPGGGNRGPIGGDLPRGHPCSPYYSIPAGAIMHSEDVDKIYSLAAGNG